MGPAAEVRSLSQNQSLRGGAFAMLLRNMPCLPESFPLCKLLRVDCKKGCRGLIPSSSSLTACCADG